MSFRGNWTRRPLPILTAALLALTGCGGSSTALDPARTSLTQPDPDVMRECRGPTPPVEGVLTDPAVQETVWRSDRVRLAECRDRHSQAIAWIAGVLEAVDGD